MNELIQTINRSLLTWVSRAIDLLPALILALIVLVITRYSVRLVKRILKTSSERLIRSASLQMLLVQISAVAVWVVGILIACTLVFPSLRLGDIIGLLGLSSVAVGFAFQDIFKNFLAGILLLLNEPFRVNDQIIINDYEGTVESINIRSTQIRTYTDERVVIPNAIVFTSPVHVLTHYASRRTDVEIGLHYDTPLPEARQVLVNALADVEGVLTKPAIEVDVAGFGDSAIKLVVRYWTLPQKIKVRRIQSEVIVALKRACDQAGFHIPYPIRTVYLPPPQPVDDHQSISSHQN
ncbi:MAG: mechanosensitive ion channel family protein [Stenomitos rutilans HA7619-LM2]|jgi:small-conductance mechanosensitive channel|nr:mechanosensitive ion channel family protein [Stenomitos rutilans HA7619-LM2]